MAEADWRKVVAALHHQSTRPTEDQRSIAAALGLLLSSRTPEPVAAVLLKRRLQPALRLAAPRHFSEAEYEYLAGLADSVGLSVPHADGLPDRDELDAWIWVARARQSIVHLKRLKPRVDDVVVAVDRRTGGDRHGVITSFGSTGRLNFKGGRGGHTWPQFVIEIIRPSEAEYTEKCRLAREDVAARVTRPHIVSHGDLKRLAPWKVEAPPGLAALEALTDALNASTEERPMQVVVEKHPALLANMTAGHHGIWVLPHVRFSDHYVADFLVASDTSAGLRWTLVELESPVQRLSNRRNKRTSPALRHAVDQIQDWRRWLSTNLAHARTARGEGGLGLPGITADAQGLIIIGREDPHDSGTWSRDLLVRDQRIEVRTYDWLVRVAGETHPLRWGLLDAMKERGLRSS